MGMHKKPENEVSKFALYYRDYRARKKAGLTKERMMDRALTKDWLYDERIWIEKTDDEIGWKVGRLEKQLTLHVNAQGYLYVSFIGFDKKCHALGLHRIIYCIFKEDIPEGMTVDHINNKKLDNRVENLQLLTRSENSKKQ